MSSNLKKIIGGLLVATMLICSCKKIKDEPPPVVKQDLDFYVLSKGKQLVKFNLKDLSTPKASVDLNGLESGEIILAIDFRPATGQLYGLGSSSRLYVINTETGMLRAIGTSPFSPALSGTMSGFDFNPTVDRIRVVTTTGQNLRLNPETGTVAAVDGAINGADGAAITAVAYTNNKAGATSTTLFDIDIKNDKLFKQDPPNNGTLVLVGSLGVDVSEEGGFDISSDGSVALAAFGEKYKESKLYYINLETGKATKIGALGKYTNITALAIPTEPVAYALDDMNNLLIFNPLNPQPVSKAITGLQAGDNLVGIDFRPLNGQLYALGSGSRIYTINTSNGAATVVGTMPFTTLLTGTSFGFDFNPTVDRIRVVSNLGQNLRINPETGAIAAVDGMINPAEAVVTAVAYTNNFAGATTTTLFDIDVASDKLFKQDPPNSGTLVEVGALGINAEQMTGFDIGGASGKAYAILTVGSTTKIYNINSSNGNASGLSAFPKSVRGFAIGLGF